MKRLCCFVLGTLLWIGPSDVRAQPNVAFELFRQGMQAMERNRFDEAVELLRASLASTARPATAFNLALALRATGRLSDASQILEGLLAGRYGELREAGADEAREVLATLQGEMSELSLDVDGPDDVQVRIDGGRLTLDRGRAVVRLDPGRHVVVVSALDHRTFEQEVRLSRGERARLAVHLEPVDDRREGVLVVESEAPDVLLEVAGRRGHSPLRVELPPGEYTVEAIAPEGRTRTRVTVPPGREVRLTMQRPRTDRRLRRSPWLWTAVSLVLIGAAAGTTIGVRRRSNDVDTAPFSQIEVPL